MEYTRAFRLRNANINSKNFPDCKIANIQAMSGCSLYNLMSTYNFDGPMAFALGYICDSTQIPIEACINQNAQFISTNPPSDNASQSDFFSYFTS
jgi:hypothetical protein